MNNLSFKIAGECKSRIRCRAFASLKIQKISSLIKEMNDNFFGSIYEGSGDLQIPNKEYWINVYIELNTQEPRFEIILPLFEEEKKDLIQTINELKNRINELKIDGTLPKITQENINGYITTTIDHQTLENAESIYFDLCNQLKFINECINELPNKSTSI